MINGTYTFRYIDPVHYVIEEYCVVLASMFRLEEETHARWRSYAANDESGVI